MKLIIKLSRGFELRKAGWNGGQQISAVYVQLRAHFINATKQLKSDAGLHLLLSRE